MAGTVADFHAWVTSQPGVVHMAHDELHCKFSIDHSVPGNLTHSALLGELLKYDVWLISDGKNKGNKIYKISAPYAPESL